MTHTTQPARGLLWQEKISRDFRRPTKYPPRPLEVIAIISVPASGRTVRAVGEHASEEEPRRRANKEDNASGRRSGEDRAGDARARVCVPVNKPFLRSLPERFSRII